MDLSIEDRDFPWQHEFTGGQPDLTRFELLRCHQNVAGWEIPIENGGLNGTSCVVSGFPLHQKKTPKVRSGTFVLASR